MLVSSVKFEDEEAAKNRSIIKCGMLCDKDLLLFCKWRIFPSRSSWQRFGHIIEKIQEKNKICGHNLAMKYIQNVRLFPTRPYNSHHCALSHLGATKVEKYSVASDDGVGMPCMDKKIAPPCRDGPLVGISQTDRLTESDSNIIMAN